jgi:mannose/fructose/sorbose-specific phosphotransferase system IIB component
MPALPILVRIDDRLIHGQVAVGWVKAISPTHIVVANDAVVQDPLQKNLMELATPSTLQLRIVPVREVARLMVDPTLDHARLLVLFCSPQDVQRAVDSGFPITQLNVGGMRFQPGKQQVLKSISLDAADVACFQNLLARGIKITVQMVPTDEQIEIQRILVALKA